MEKEKLYNITFANATLDDIAEALKSLIPNEEISKYIKDHNLVNEETIKINSRFKYESRFVEFIWKDEDLKIDDKISIDPLEVSSFNPYTIDIQDKEIKGILIIMKTSIQYIVPYTYEQVKEMLS